METEVTCAIRVHPGEILREEWLAPLNLTPYALAKGLGVPQTRVHEILKERRGITADTALRLSRYLGCSPRFWLNLQTQYDLAVASHEIGAELEAIVPLPRPDLEADKEAAVAA